MSAALELGILGPLEIRRQGVAVELRAPRARALLCALCVSSPAVASTDALIDALWGEQPPKDAANALQWQVSQLRRALGPDAVRTEPPGYVLAVEADRIDARRFERLTAEGRGQASAAAARAVLVEALALWRGPALADVRYADWASVEANRLDELRLAALELRLAAELELGHAAEVVGEVEAVLGEHRLRERLHGLRMRALYGSGRQVEALEAYRELRRMLDEELGLEPGEELKALERQILAHDPALVPATAEPRARRAALPLPPNELIGRESELEAVVALLEPPGARLVTLVGPGGIGKTRLALAAAGRLGSRVEGGAVVVWLASVQDPQHVAASVAQAVDVHEQAGEALTDTLVRSLADAPPLLVLDNFEHLLAATPLVAQLVAGVAGLRVLVTSRAPLRLGAEVEHAVPELDEVASVALFVERARAVRPGFSLDERSTGDIADVCRAVDGLPLAIELAAARIRILEPRALRLRLGRQLDLLAGGARDLPARQRTMRATIAWSHDLLDEPERRLLARLSVFAGGFTLDAAEDVCGPGLGHDPLPALEALVENSLAREVDNVAGELRFGLLATIREDAAERLAAIAADVVELPRRHAAWIAALSESSAEQLGSGEEEVVLARLRAEIDNVRAALAWAESAGEHELYARIVSGFGLAWSLSGLVGEGAAYLERAEQVADALPPALRAHLARFAGMLALERSQLDAAERSARRAVALFEQVGDRAGVLGALNLVAGAVYYRGDLATAATVLEREILPVARELGHPPRIGDTLSNLAEIAFAERDYERARGFAEEAVATCGAGGDRWGEASARSTCAAVYLGLGDERAESLARAAVDHLERIGDRSNVIPALIRLGRARALDDHVEAEAVQRRALDLAWQTDRPGYVADALLGLAATAGARGDLADAARLRGLAEAAAARAGRPPESYPADDDLAARGREGLGEARWDALTGEGADVEAGVAAVLREPRATG